MTGKFMTKVEVCRDVLNITIPQFRKLRPQLEAEGFPLPAISGGTPQSERWDPLDLTAWRRRKLPREERAGTAIDFDAEAAELDRRAETLAKGRPH